MKKYIFALLLLNQILIAQNKYSLTSPNNIQSIEIVQEKNGEMFYTVKSDNLQLIGASQMGYKLKNGESIPSKDWAVTSTGLIKVKSTWKPLWGKRSVVPDVYNELNISLSNPTSTSLKKINITARAYNDCIAFRYKIPESETGSAEVESELTSYNFSADYTAWFYNGENHNIGPLKLTECDKELLPVMTVEADNSHYLAIHEANLGIDYPLVLSSTKGSTQFNVASSPKELSWEYTSAWRVILLGSTPGKLVDSHTIELLNPDPSPFMDFSWVKPGVCVWDWRIDGAEVDGFKYSMSYPSWIRMVDFASKQGFKALVLDANWYGPEFAEVSDPVAGEKANDVKRLLAYAKTKNVGIWLYLNDVAGKKYDLEQTLKQYGSWGAAGVKYGFMSGNALEKNIRTKKITELCATNKLMIDFHDGPVHPYGQMRTFPNAVTREYCHAQLDAHRVFSPKTFTTTVFVNMIAGPLDMNNGMFDLRQGNTTRTDESQPVPSTVVSEAARTLIVFSGATILPDIPEFYTKYTELLDFISKQKMPWKESKTLDGKIGEYIVMMRETDDAYLIGAANNEIAKSVSIDFSFLPKGKHELLMILDREDADYLTNREVYKTEKKTVTNNDKVVVKLAAGGGACMILKKK